MTDGRTESTEADILQALAGAVLIRDRLAEVRDSEGLLLAVHTVDAFNRVRTALGFQPPSGPSGMVIRDDKPPVPGFASA